MDFRHKIERLMHWGLLAFILAGAAFLSAITTIRIAIQSHQVQMPNLTGKTVTEAQSILQQNGLELRIADRTYDASPAGHIIRQSPPAGTQVKASQDAHVVVSLGPMRVTVPDLEGKDVRAARIILLQAGLQIGEISAPYLEGPAPDTILQQTQAPGAQASNPRVDVLAPDGPRPRAIIMPFLIGMSQSQAEQTLMSVGVKNIRTAPMPAPQWPFGSVLDQSPAAGAKLALDGPVELKVVATAGPDIRNGNPANN
jgi:eukaryotic-like serine/threonine-protein kinase